MSSGSGSSSVIRVISTPTSTVSPADVDERDELDCDRGDLIVRYSPRQQG
jgi:hypothetical protein